MPTPKDRPGILTDWKELEKKLILEENLATYKAYEKIARIYGIHRDTVYYWLDSKYRANKRVYAAIKPRVRQSNRPRPGRYHREPYRKEYDLAYKRLVRSLPNLISETLASASNLSLEELSDSLARVGKSDPSIGRTIHLNYATLQKKLQKYLHLPLVPSVYEVRLGIYRLRIRTHKGSPSSLV